MCMGRWRLSYRTAIGQIELHTINEREMLWLWPIPSVARVLAEHRPLCYQQITYLSYAESTVSFGVASAIHQLGGSKLSVGGRALLGWAKNIWLVNCAEHNTTNANIIGISKFFRFLEGILLRSHGIDQRGATGTQYKSTGIDTLQRRRRSIGRHTGGRFIPIHFGSQSGNCYLLIIWQNIMRRMKINNIVLFVCYFCCCCRNWTSRESLASCVTRETTLYHR